jgi:hypothetical protein
MGLIEAVYCATFGEVVQSVSEYVNLCYELSLPCSMPVDIEERLPDEEEKTDTAYRDMFCEEGFALPIINPETCWRCIGNCTLDKHCAQRHPDTVPY